MGTNRARKNARGGGPGAQKHAHTTPDAPHDRQGKADDLFHTSNPTHGMTITPGAHTVQKHGLKSP